VLALFGIGALIGTAVGGRFADAHLFGVLLSGIATSTVLLVALALLAQYAVAAVLLSFLLGVSCFYTAPALNARLFNVAGTAPTLAGATTTAAFNLGNTGGPWIGGVVIDAGHGFTATAWAGGAIMAAAIGTTAVSLRLHRRTRASRLVTGSGELTGGGEPTGGGSGLGVNPVRTDA
jgi:DHA1 family chloramphenicol resistance protein-like MFS transporter